MTEYSENSMYEPSIFASVASSLNQLKNQLTSINLNIADMAVLIALGLQENPTKKIEPQHIFGYLKTKLNLSTLDIVQQYLGALSDAGILEGNEETGYDMNHLVRKAVLKYNIENPSKSPGVISGFALYCWKEKNPEKLPLALKLTAEQRKQLFG